MRRAAAGVIAALVVVVPALAAANGEGTGGPPTVFERVVLSACSPGVREAYPVATLSVAPMVLSGFPRAAVTAAARPVEIGIEVLRAHQPGRPDWRSLALRVTLTVGGGAGGETFRLGSG